MPADWNQVTSWLVNLENLEQLQHPATGIKLKNPEIPLLDNYSIPPPADFWKHFPHNPAPKGIRTQVNVAALKARICQARSRWTTHTTMRAYRVVKDLEEGARAFQKVVLPPAKVANSGSAARNGRQVTDTLASWHKVGFVCGPFDTPPLPAFRSNCILAICQKDKVRLVLDMSQPDGRSFNDNVDRVRVEHVKMSTAKSFSFSVMDAGRGALMSKHDMKDAYKLIPCRKEDWRLQGMCWLGKYFFETQMIFGATPAVPNYDGLSSTTKELALIPCSIPSHLVHRTLDDTPTVAPANTTWGLEFAESYEAVCKELNIPLAAPCPKMEKAFVNQTAGKVLGIWFDTEKMEWSYPMDKTAEAIQGIHEILASAQVPLGVMQKIMGRLNDVAQLCPFLKAFRKPTSDFMASFKGDEDLLLPVPDQVKADLRVAGRIVLAAAKGLPIVARPSAPPLNFIRFTSDAAGASWATVEGQRVANPGPGRRGVASVRIDEEGNLAFMARIQWPDEFIYTAQDEKGCCYGDKSTTLETIGLLLPFLASPEEVAGRHVVLQVDNVAAIYGWESRQVKGDVSASILIRALHLVSSYLACKIYPKHLPRMSSEEGTLADHLSRDSSTTAREEERVSRVERVVRSPALIDWLENPVPDWDLAMGILSNVISNCANF